MGCIALLIWFLLWMGDKTPYLLNSWNPWNIALLVIVAISSLATGRRVSK